MYQKICLSVFFLFTILTFIYSNDSFFDSQREYPMGGYINTIVEADFNNDGYPDFACGSVTYTSEYFDYLNIYINNGDGTFQDPEKVVHGRKISIADHGDFNNDGWLDLVTVTENNNNLNIIMNQGDGSFVLAQTYLNYGSPSLTVMDMNADGYDDIIQIQYNGMLNILFSNGDGTFAIGDAGELVVYLQMDFYGTLVTWDVDHNTYPDLLIYGQKIIYTDSVNYYFQKTITTYVNNADSTFQEGVEFLFGDSLNSTLSDFESAYFNSDSEKDILISDATGYWDILKGNSDGSFSRNSTFVKDVLKKIRCGDINGDGFSDLVVSDNFNASVSVMLNKGTDDISFADSVNYSGKYAYGASYTPGLLITDLNKDKHDDIIQYDWTLSVIMNYGDGTFPMLKMVEDAGGEFSDMLCEDFNGDGFSDIMTFDGSIHIQANDGNANFSDLQSINPVISDPRGIFSGDFNLDDIVDFAVIGTGGFRLFYGQPEGGFHDTLGSILGYDGLSADFNNDGIIDFATIYSGSGTGLQIMLSDSTGSHHVDSYSMGFGQDIAIADIDNDKDLDIVVGSYNNASPGGPGQIYIRYNDGQGGFADMTLLTTEFMTMGVLLEDLNNDSYPDLAVTQYGTYDGYVSVYLNNQDGTFLSMVNYGRLYAPAYRDIEWVDMDNDGDPDLLATIEAYDIIAVLLNQGDGTFPEIHYYNGGDNIKTFTVGYFDNDSTIDIAVGSSARGGKPYRDLVYIFPNTGLNLLPVSAIKNISEEIQPEIITLLQNYPNPFNPITTIEYSVRAHGNVPQHVNLSIYDLLGQKVATLVNKKQAAGSYQVQWEASSFSTGIYYYQLSTGDYRQVKKMIMIK